ncbi:acyl-coenzyme A:6-aminopenicillanic acid acyl-transferase-domain-containing protein [Chaetomium fimeti]|uniref:Acyl-coenzyme A:6-aminopenicillanic acid acyl-transferase-domain-containing protein n=1 Tax=Chaetomium fimeti TaxID=1854472 RepID=A0AAE0HJL3_9PEZI|nr:acyl-coenzyme A:6-aminopenicillanic acid acyl-transferase-domain-containing protein [Chaetomium fimeti]
MSGCGTADNPVCIEEYSYDGKPEQIIGLLLRGTPTERGKTYGLWLRDEIRANVTRHRGHPHLPSWSFCIDMAKVHYIPGLKKYWQSGWMELQGMSEGSGVPIEDLVVLNAWDDLAALQIPLAERTSESTTAFFSKRATADKVPILAHSWSSLAYPADAELLVCLEIQYNPSEEKPNIFMVTEAGRISGCGMNAKGVAATGNWLLSTDDMSLGKNSKEFPMTCFERFVLEYASVNGARDVVDETSRHSSRHILVADGAGCSASLEVGPEHIFFHGGEFGSRAIVHVNHFQSFDAFSCRREIKDRYEGKYSQFRLSRFSELIKRNDADVSMQQIMGMFSDHEGKPESICEHGDNFLSPTTMAFVVFDMKRRVISVCKGPPCEGAMSHFTFSREEHSREEHGREGHCRANKKKPGHAYYGDMDDKMFQSELDKLMAAAKADAAREGGANMPLTNGPVSEAARSPPLAPVRQDLVTIAAQGLMATDMDWDDTPPPASDSPQAPSRDRAASPTKGVLAPPGGDRSKLGSSDQENPKRKTPPTSPVSEISSLQALLGSVSSGNLENQESGRPEKRTKFWDPARDEVQN